MKTTLAGLALGLALVTSAAPAMQLDKLGGMMGGSSSLTSGSTSNVAGLLQYCVSNNYLGGASASSASGIKDKLLGSVSGDKSAASPEPTQDKGYLDGAKGLLTAKDGKTTDLNSLGGGSSVPGTEDMKAKMIHKACDAVLKQGKSLAGM